MLLQIWRDPGIILINSIYTFLHLVLYLFSGLLLNIKVDYRIPPGFDRTRNVEIGNKNYKLEHLEEAFTTEHWIVRIYKVKDLPNRLDLTTKS
jgi:dolichyl-diphosphooligosaccharide--protein glycosyltransferase